MKKILEELERVEKKFSDFPGLNDHRNRKYKDEKIIAIDAQGSAAVELYPFSYVICPEWRRQSTIIDKCIFRKDSYYKIW